MDFKLSVLAAVGSVLLVAVMPPADLTAMTLQDLIATTYANWPTIGPTAAAYLNALDVHDCEELSDPVGNEDAQTQIRYFLGAAAGWRGETARAVKVELRRRLAQAQT